MDSEIVDPILPPEIWIQIFTELEWNDLLPLQRVCKAFQKWISTAGVQYKIHLGIAGFNDGPDTHPMTVSERLETLKQAQAAFSRGKFGIKRSISLSGYTPTYEYQGGVFLQGRHEIGSLYQTRGANVFQFPSYVSSTPTRKWKLPNFRHLVRDFTLDPMQDLLVVIENDMDSRVDNPRFLKFLSLTTGAQHPLSSKPVKITQFTFSARASFVVTVMGDFVGLLTSPAQFFICNWKSGNIVFFRDFNSTDPIHDFFFLDQEKFCLVRGRRSPPQLEIYQFISSKSSSESSSDPTAVVIDDAKLTAIYHLPKTADGIVLTVSCRSDPPGPPPTTPYPASPVGEKPFFVKMEDRILIFTLRMEDGNTHSYQDLVVRAETLINTPPEATSSPPPLQDSSSPAYSIEAENASNSEENTTTSGSASTGTSEGVPVVTSEMWMRKTRLWDSVTLDRYWVCYCYGSRFTIITPRMAGSRRSKIKILDFNPRFCDWMQAQKRAEAAAKIAHGFKLKALAYRQSQKGRRGQDTGDGTDAATADEAVPQEPSDVCPWETSLPEREGDDPTFKPNRRFFNTSHTMTAGRFIAEDWISELPCVVIELVTTSRLDKFRKAGKGVDGWRNRLNAGDPMRNANDEEDVEDVVEVLDKDDGNDEWEDDENDDVEDGALDDDETGHLDAMIDEERLVLVKLQYNWAEGYKEPVSLQVFTV